MYDRCSTFWWKKSGPSHLWGKIALLARSQLGGRYFCWFLQKFQLKLKTWFQCNARPSLPRVWCRGFTTQSCWVQSSFVLGKLSNWIFFLHCTKILERGEYLGPRQWILSTFFIFIACFSLCVVSGNFEEFFLVSKMYCFYSRN